MSGRWPNFLIVGAARSGTTALFNFLGEHPEIFCSRKKEPHFFAFPGRTLRFRGPGDDETINRRAVTDQEEYMNLFAGVGAEKAIGESSVSYLYYEEAPRNIRRILGGIKIIVVLREPAERAFSNFQLMRSTVREPLARFEDALAAEEERIRLGWHHIWHYRNLGYYARQLSRYYCEFDAEQIYPLVYDDFRADPEGAVRRVFEFLGVDPHVEIPAVMEMNISGRPRSRFLARELVRSTRLKRAVASLLPDKVRARLVTFLRRRLLIREAIPPAARTTLREEYREDLEALQELIGRDLGAWLKPVAGPEEPVAK